MVRLYKPWLGEAIEEKILQKVEKVQKGGEGSARKIKKSKIWYLDFLISGMGGYIFFFPQM